MDKDKGVLAIDLDGTLAKREQPFNPYSVGEPVEKLLKAALAEKAKGRKIVCFTARAASKDKKMHETVRAWLDKHGLEGVEITNEKTPDIGEVWDDRARGVVPDKGVFTDGKKAAKKKTADKFWHGSPVSGIKELEPRSSKVLDGEPAVFAVENTDDALVFARRWSDEDIELGTEEGTRYMREQYPGAFEHVFNGPGVLYEVEDSGFTSDPRLMRSERISKSKTKVLGVREIANVLEALRDSGAYDMRPVQLSDKGVFTDGKKASTNWTPTTSAELDQRARMDQEYRWRGSSPAQRQHAQQQDVANTEWLDGEVNKSGWPSGSDGEKAWLLAQHADARPMMQASLLNSAEQSGTASPSNLAYLKDRTLVNNNKPQVFGTQGRPASSGSWEPLPVSNPAGLATRRSAAGLSTMSQYKTEMHNIVKQFPAQPTSQALKMPFKPVKTDSPNLSPYKPVKTAAEKQAGPAAELQKMQHLLDSAKPESSQHLKDGEQIPLEMFLPAGWKQGDPIPEEARQLRDRVQRYLDADLPTEKRSAKSDDTDVPGLHQLLGYDPPQDGDADVFDGMLGVVANLPADDERLQGLRLDGLDRHNLFDSLRNGQNDDELLQQLKVWDEQEDQGKPPAVEDMRKYWLSRDRRGTLQRVYDSTLGSLFDPRRKQAGSAKSASGKFMRPENYDCISKLEKADVEIWEGCNDWENATTWMWAAHRPKGPDVNNESLVWVELKYPSLPHPGDTDVSSEDLAKIKQLAKRLPKEWEAEAKKIESPPTLEAFEKALQSDKLKPFVEASGFKDSRDGMRKWASAIPSSPQDTDVRGPRRLLQMLKNLDLAKLEAQALADAKSGKITKRDKAVKILSAIEGLKRTGVKPEELMITRVPVLPPVFRPFSTMGTTFIPGSANELYQDLFRHRQAHKETLRELGEDMAGNTRLNLLNAVRALYGYGDPVSPKLQGRETKGYLKQVLGSGGPKYSFVQRKLLSRPIDSVGRGVITVDPDLNMNQISIPEELAWETYGSHVQRRLVQSLGMKPVEALKMVKDRTKEAQLALKQEMSPETGRPVIYSRAPAWHKFNTVAGWAKLHTGHNIAISPFTSAGMNADFDGDQCLNQLLACIPSAALSSWRMSYHNIDSHEIRFPQGSSIPTIQDGKVFLFDLEDFPHGELQHTKEGAKGRIDFHAVPHPIQVLAYDEQTGGLKWADVAFWSKHYQREIEIVDTHNGYQIITDDDPRAVYGTEAGTLNMKRFTPTAAATVKALVPRARNLPAATTTVHTVPGNQDSKEPRSIRMRDDVPLNSTVGWVLGALCGDGWVIKTEGRTKGFALADNDGHNVTKLRTSVREILADGATCTEWSVSSKASDPGRYGDTTSYRFTGMNVGNWLRALIGGERDENSAGSANKHLPPFYLATPEEFRSGLLCGLLDTDGSISVSHGKASPQLMSNFCSTSIRLCIETKLLAASLGIFGRITPSQTPLGKPCWTLSFSNRDIQRWGAPFMCHGDKLKALRSVPLIQDSPVTAKYDIVPISQACADAVARVIGCPKISKKQRATADPTWLAGRKDTQALFMSFAQARNPRHAKYGTVSRQQALRAIDLLGRDTVAGMPDGPAWLQVVDSTEVTWERVTGVQKTGIKEDGYDLTVPGYETFMSADGIILSNTLNVSVPILPESVEEAKKKLMPDKMLFTIRDQESVMAQPKHEMVLGLYTAATRPSGRVFKFDSKQKAIAAVENGDVNYDDDIEFPGD